MREFVILLVPSPINVIFNPLKFFFFVYALAEPADVAMVDIRLAPAAKIKGMP